MNIENTAMQEILAKLDDFFASKKGEILADTAALVNINSVRGEALEGKPFGEGPAKALAEAEIILKKHGLTVKNYDNYFVTGDMAPENGSADNEPALAMLAHLDVVEEGDGWTYPPYTMTLDRGTEEGIDGEIMYGRGTSDDKGPAIAALYALKAAASIAPLKKGVRIILGSAEETGSEDIDYYNSHCKMPPMVFSPDADFPLINIEKGRYAPTFYANVEPLKAEDAAEGIYLIGFKGGETANIVPHKASCVVKGITAERLSETISKITKETDLEAVSFEISEGEAPGTVNILSVGKGSHAASPAGGINAQAALVKLLLALPVADNDPAKKHLESLQKLLPFGDTNGTAIGIKMSDDLSGALTCAFTVLSYENNIISGQIDIRSPICGTRENVANVVDKALSSAGFIVNDTKMNPPHCTDENSPFVQTLLRSYEDVTRLEGKCLAIGGGTYVHHIEGGVAFGCAMPGIDTRIHGANEFMPVNDLINSAKIFALAILRLCC